MSLKQKKEESLVCPKCGNTNINEAGIPMSDGTHLYQCQSDHGIHGCGYLADKKYFAAKVKTI